MAQKRTQDWEIWYPQAAATGLLFARGRVDAGAEVMLVHAAPTVLTVAIRGADGRVLAEGTDLRSTNGSPITKLTRRGEHITREDAWPTASDLGLPVLLAGGEAGILKEWWHAADRSEWRWQIELYNHR